MKVKKQASSPEDARFSGNIVEQSNSTKTKKGVPRRDFLKWSALAGTGASIAGTLAAPAILHAENRDQGDVPKEFNEATVTQLQAAMASGETSSAELTRFYLARIQALDKDDQDGPGVNSVLEVNPDALTLAREADELRRHGKVLGPLHGIPVMCRQWFGWAVSLGQQISGAVHCLLNVHAQSWTLFVDEPQPGAAYTHQYALTGSGHDE